jgi:hypothetical protein
MSALLPLQTQRITWHTALDGTFVSEAKKWGQTGEHIGYYFGGNAGHGLGFPLFPIYTLQMRVTRLPSQPADPNPSLRAGFRL